MKFVTVTAIAVAAFAGAATAHEGVENEAVKARMMLMDKVKTATGTLGGMAKGAVAYDAGAADAAKAALAEHAAAIPAAFEAKEMDPKSTAKPAIWDNWADFVAKAEAMGGAAAALDTSSQASIGAGMGGIGGSCQACHKVYRVKK